MIASDLIALGRVRYLDDLSDTYPLWSDEELLSALNWAQRKAAEWGLLLKDSATPAICSITLVDGQAVYPIDPRVVTIESITLVHADGRETDVTAMNRKDILWMFGETWRVAKGQPKAFEPTKTNTIRVVRVPNAVWAGKTLRVSCNRLPLADMTLIDQPELPSSMHEDLLYGMCSQAYLKRDADTYDPGASQRYMAMFMDIFAPSVSHTTRMEQFKEGEQEQGGKRKSSVSNWEAPDEMEAKG
jgi:hypothetical protein